MITLKNLYHGTDKYFDHFDDSYLGRGSGTGYIKAHWFTNGGAKSEKAARLFAEQRGISKKHYIYNVQINVNKNSIVHSYDKLDKKLTKNQIDILKSKSIDFRSDMTFESFIQSNDNAYNLLININIVVIIGWTPDNGLCHEYISLLTAIRTDLCTIKSILI